MASFRRRRTAPYGSIALLMMVALACNALTPAGVATPQTEAEPTVVAAVTNTVPPNGEPGTLSPSLTPSPAAVEPSRTPKPTAEKPQLEILGSRLWIDYQQNVRAIVLLRNPYDYPVAPNGGAGAVLLDSAGERMYFDQLYFLDGISGGGGFLLPGETIGATACFNCEAAPITKEWADVKFSITIEDATDLWKYSTDVVASNIVVSFNGDRPLFDVTGNVTNNSGTEQARISMRVNVFNDAGDLVGVAETAAYDVPAGATVSVNGYGIGQTPDGSFTFEVTALGVNY